MVAFGQGGGRPCVQAFGADNLVADLLGRAVAFGILCAMMASAMVVFMLGNKSYGHSARRKTKNGEQNPLARMGGLFVAAFKNWKSSANLFLNKALLATSSENGKLCSVTDVEEAKQLLRLIPIWTTVSAYTMVYAQPNTSFTKQELQWTEQFSLAYKFLQLHFNSALALPLFSSFQSMTAFSFR
ncbi:hypothetical protein JRO89_XS07G0265500 [Xanthoceras sorbifolium]|uniref:CASP-like protein n=1 Tax=Xanthoceras sorbifolium TaxID=99658 RepID=A0ABQ8HV62_9ROSI|nr:hypothetical protein JRO89_XS07G0265500 [Xanthoceras sorbifolium]